MNREIKFRAWNIPNKLMYQNVQDGLLAENEKGQLVLGVSLGKLSKDIGSVLMQFTGLKDKKGKEIYENDIVKTEDGNCEIIYQDGGFVYLLKNETFCPAYNWHIEEIEIIGNTFEDANLLQGVS